MSFTKIAAAGIGSTGTVILENVVVTGILSASSITGSGSAGNVGIGTTNPTSKLWVNGDGYFVGVVTSSGFYVNGALIGGSISGTDLVGTALSVTGISTFSNGPVLIGTATSTGTASQRLQIAGDAYVSGNLGIGITNPTNTLQVGAAISMYGATGIISATSFYGSGTNLTGLIPNIVSLTAATTPHFIGFTTTSSGVTTSIFASNTLTYIPSSGNLGIGTINPTQSLHILGNARVTGAFYDSTNATGTTGQVLQSTATGTLWATAAGGGGSGTFDTGITTTTFVSVDSGIGTAITGIVATQANNDVFLGPGIALSFPNIAGNRYVIQSIHVANTFDNELYLTARHDFNNGTLKVPVANRVVVPYNGALELLEQPTIANPGDILRLQALTGIGTTAGGVDGGLDAWITYSTKTDTNFVGVGTTVTTAGTNVGGISTYQTVYTSTGYPSVIQSIRIANYNLFIDVDASIAIFSSLGIRKGHLAYNLTIPKNSIVELCQQPKRLETSETIGVSVGSITSGGANALSVCVSSKYITS